ncbi:MAG: hypothetical protein R3Y10_03295 [Ferrimonas sp.]
MEPTPNALETLLRQRFREAESIAELREQLRDIEELLHAVFAEKLERFVQNEPNHSGNHE